MKFGLVVPSEFAEHMRSQAFEISGLLQWVPALGGKLYTINEDFSDRDVLMTNVSSTETEYASIIRQIVPDAKIIGVFDYGWDVIGDYFTNMERVREVMSRMDYLFSVCKNQHAWMKLFLPDKEIHYIPHPTDIDNMLKFRKPKEDRNQGVGCFYHQYESQHLQMLEIMKAVDRRLKKHVPRMLIGLKSRIAIERGLRFFSSSIPIVNDSYPDVNMRGKPIDPEMMKYIEPAPPGVAWDSCLPYLGVEPWYDALSRFTMCLDSYTINSVGRFGIDCAGTGIPLVASDMQDSSRLLFPFTTVSPHNPLQTVEMVTKVLLDKKDFTGHIEKVATKNLKHFSFSASKERMLRMLET